jgi:hypothetical protein
MSFIVQRPRSFDIEQMKLVLTVAPLVARIENESMAVPMVGVWWNLRLLGFWRLESGGRFCVGAFCKNLASVATQIYEYSHLF